MSVKPCLDCGRNTTNGSRCKECEQAREARRRAAYERRNPRPSPSARGYTRQWRAQVKAAIARQPFCSVCGHPGSPDNPLTGDHVTPRAQGGAGSGDNIQVLCRRCNSRKGARSEG